MTTTAQFAYGNARVRARKAGLLSSAVLVALAAAERPGLTIDGWHEVESDADAASLVALMYARLTDDFDTVIRAYPSGAALLRALARRHELENVKLAWRATAQGTEPARWLPLWRPLGRLETVSCGRCAAVTSLDQLASALSKTPFEAIARAALRDHGADAAAAEIAFDRWGSETLMTSSTTLPAGERIARDLVWRIVCERDVAVFQRAIGFLRLAPMAAIRMTSTLRAALGSAGVRQLAEWSADGGAPLRLPRLLSAGRWSVQTFAELRHAIRGSLRAACQQVFLADPFCLAPAIALVLLREDELRAVISIGELRVRRASTSEAARVLDFDG